MLLPHLHGRPLTMVRLPDGVEGERFFEKRCPGHRPDWLHTVPLDAGSDIASCAVDDLPGLVWVANLAALELHTPQARADDPLRPTAMVFDLDPGAPADVRDCARVALDLRDVLGQLGLHAVVKTSGSKGLHLSVGLRPSVDADQTKAFALALGRILESRDPKRVTVNMARDQRAGARVRRLEPERPPQDDRVRVLVARDPAPAGVDATDVGRSGRGRRHRRRHDAAVRARRSARTRRRRSATPTRAASPRTRSSLSSAEDVLAAEPPRRDADEHDHVSQREQGARGSCRRSRCFS